LRRPNSKDFAVHGGHSSLSQVELPPWLPKEIASATLSEFKDHLLSGIIQMMEKVEKKKKKRHL
jgi:hypothetical protein